ncbi:unnamed protein product [Nesidiocoris tenuis]|uniref:LRRCT domain-containing protein n=1 Tax=Nesidiocoris tenuis TaxID=355587 RepID=A0A6H5FXJ4_9HEMI|nr:unnamed protein product [Nesidiocoris tenuis]
MEQNLPPLSRYSNHFYIDGSSATGRHEGWLGVGHQAMGGRASPGQLGASGETAGTVKYFTLFVLILRFQEMLLDYNSFVDVPSSSLNGPQALKHLSLQNNRIELELLDVSRNSIGNIAPGTFLALRHLKHLDLSVNTLRTDFKKLKLLDLSGNLLLNIEMASFAGLEETLGELRLRGNRLSSLPNKPMMLLKLTSLDLSHNHITDLPRTSFLMVSNLLSLNLSHNQQLSAIPSTLFHPLTQLLHLDLSHCALKLLSPELLMKTVSLHTLSLRRNFIEELTEAAFQNLRNLTNLDLSQNVISNIRPGCFSHLPSLKQLDLSGNKLTSFKGEFFLTRRSNGTKLEYLDLSNNDLSYLFPSSFRVHPRLKKLIASRNRFSFFPAELVIGLNHLQTVDLSENMLKSLEEFDFGRLPRLRTLKLNSNLLESVSETAFHNSTQLQHIDLSMNKLERLGERTFQGLGRLKWLNLADNLLAELPESIFERSKLRMLENVDLSNNLFEVPPLKSLQRQYFFLNSVNLSKNKIKDIPPDDSIMVNIKVLDLSFNNLTAETVANVLGEPKTVRELNLAGTGIEYITRLETPFLHNLNLSYNQIASIPEKVFERPTLLEVLDLSHNSISSISGTGGVWSKLKNLEVIDLSSNPINTIMQSDFEGLQSLKKLNISNLEECSKIEKAAFKNLVNLAELEAYNYPRLGYLDVTGLLHSLPSLEHLDVEVKDAAIGSEQLSAAMNPRLHNLGIRGSRVKSISSSALAGLKSPRITVKVKDTSLNTLLPALLIPLPRSSKIDLDVSDNQISTLTPQFLSALDDRRGDLTLSGLEANPISCDCNSRALRRTEFGAKIICSSPEYLQGKRLVEIGDDDLTCDPHRQTTSTTPEPTTTSTTTTARSTRYHNNNHEPDIIWSVDQQRTAPTTRRTPNRPPYVGAATVTNDDTLIISIVGGVVAFIAVLIVIICVVKLRWSDPNIGAGPGYLTPHWLPHCANPACPCPKLPQMMPPPPSVTPYAMSYATLPGKRMTPSSASPPLRTAYSTLGRNGHYPPQAHHPFFISYPQAGDEKENGSR